MTASAMAQQLAAASQLQRLRALRERKALQASQQSERELQAAQQVVRDASGKVLGTVRGDTVYDASGKAIGKVVDGTDVVDKIKGVSTTSKAGHQDVPVEDVIVEKAEII